MEAKEQVTILTEQVAILGCALRQIAQMTENMSIAGLDRANALVLLTKIKAAADEALEESAHITTTEYVAGLVMALRDCKECLMRLPDVEGAFRVTCIDEARQALAGTLPQSQVRESLENLRTLAQDETKPLPHRLITNVATELLAGGVR